MPKNKSKTSNHNNKKKLWLKFIIETIIHILISIGIIYIAYVMATNTKKIIIDQLNTRVFVTEHKKLIITEIADVSFYTILVMGVIISLINLGVEKTTFLTVLGTLMVTLGLALQGTLSNIFVGVSIALSDQFRIGDRIQIRSPNSLNILEGEVISFTISDVIVKEKDTGTTMFIPNNLIYGNVINNLSRPGVASSI